MNTILDSIHDGSIPAIYQLILIIMGNSAQSYKIWKAKSVVSTSGILQVMTIIGCLIWGEYARFNGNMPVLIPQIFAVFFTSITIYQIILYRKPAPVIKVEIELDQAA